LLFVIWKANLRNKFHLRRIGFSFHGREPLPAGKVFPVPVPDFPETQPVRPAARAGQRASLPSATGD
jgi:hypothetical protein